MRTPRSIWIGLGAFAAGLVASNLPQMFNILGHWGYIVTGLDLAIALCGWLMLLLGIMKSLGAIHRQITNMGHESEPHEVGR